MEQRRRRVARKSDSHVSQSVTQSRVVHKVRRSVDVQHDTTYSSEGQYRYQFDEWEKRPKTDYTYAKTKTYVRLSPLRQIEPPNMARDHLHRDRDAVDSVRQTLFTAHSTEKHANKRSHRSARKSHHASAIDQSPSRHTYRYEERHSHMIDDVSDGEESTSEMASNREQLTYSATRSGRTYRFDKRRSFSSMASSTDDEELMEERRRVAKRREYAGLSTGLKELFVDGESQTVEGENSEESLRNLHRIQLYGLDNGEMDISDSESSTLAQASYSASSVYSSASRRTSVISTAWQHIKAKMYTLYEFLCWLLWSTCTTVFYVLAAPYYLVRYLTIPRHLPAEGYDEVDYLQRSQTAAQYTSSTSHFSTQPLRRTHTTGTTSRTYTVGTPGATHTYDSASRTTSLDVASSANIVESTSRMLSTNVTSSQEDTATEGGGVASTISTTVRSADRRGRSLDAGKTILDAAATVSTETNVGSSNATTANVESAESSIVNAADIATYSARKSTRRQDKMTNRRRSHAMSTRNSRTSMVQSEALLNKASIAESRDISEVNEEEIVASNAGLLYGTSSAMSHTRVSDATSRSSAITTVERTLWTRLWTSTRTLWTGVLTSMRTLWTTLVTFTRTLSTMFMTILSASYSGIKTVIATPFKALRSVISRSYTGISSVFSVSASGQQASGSTMVTSDATSKTTSRRTRSSAAYEAAAASIESESSTGFLNTVLFDSWLGRRLYTAVTYLYVVDTWLLRRKGCGLCCFLPLLLLLPLFLSGAYYIQQDEALREEFRLIMFGAGKEGTSVPVIPTSPCDEQPPGAKDRTFVPIASLSEDEIRTIIGQVMSEKEKTQGAKASAMYSEISQQQVLLRDELTVLMAQVDSRAEADRQGHADAASAQTDHTNQLLAINARLQTIEGLIQKLESGQGNLETRAESDKRELEAAIAGLRADLTGAASEKEAALMGLFQQLESSVAGKDSELRVLFTDIIKAQLTGYSMKDDVDAEIKGLAAKIADISANNDNIKSNLDLAGDKTDARLNQILVDLSSTSVKIEEWNSKLEAMKADLEAKQQVAAENASADASRALLLGGEVQQLQDAIAALTAQIDALKASCCGGAKVADTAEKEEMLLLMAGDKEELATLRSKIETMGQQLNQAAASGGLHGEAVYNGLSEDQINGMIAKAIATYHADRTGKVDYALESAGGSIVSIRCSETYPVKTAQFSVMGIPLWYASSSPRSIIQPEVYPGQCWAMTGSSGFVVVQLAGSVALTEFSLEHIPRSLAPAGNISSAPRDFSVWGLEHLKDFPGTNLGNYTYDDSGEPLQTFSVQRQGEQVFSLVELRVHNNWGHPTFTCLYRFRVHGHLRNYLYGAPSASKDEL